MSASNTWFTFLGPRFCKPQPACRGVVRVAPPARKSRKLQSRKSASNTASMMRRYRSLQQPDPRPRGDPQWARFRVLPGPFGYFKPAGPVVRDRRRLEAVVQIFNLFDPLLQLALKTGSALLPVDAAGRRAGSSWPHVSVRNSGVSKCANEVNRTVPIQFWAFFAI